MPKLKPTVDERARAVFRHFNPERTNDRGYQSWLMRELAKHGIDVSRKTISLWLRDGLPPDRIQDVDAILTLLEDVMIENLEARLAEVRR